MGLTDSPTYASPSNPAAIIAIFTFRNFFIGGFL
jgi:hypothetical protein